MKVFIADDSSVTCERLISMISSVVGAEVIDTAQDGQQSIDGILKLNPDMVILYTRLPSRNGIDILCHIRYKQVTLKNYNLHELHLSPI